jgi:hypothetical protein
MAQPLRRTSFDDQEGQSSRKVVFEEEIMEAMERCDRRTASRNKVKAMGNYVDRKSLRS